MANEKRLIYVNALKKDTCEWCNEHYPDDPCEPSECPAMEYIDKLPTVDAVEVVRCKDCKHFNHLEKGCDYHGYWYHVRVEADAFCSYGERRAEDG